MAKAGKRIEKAREGIDRKKLYDLGEAVKLLKERASAKFDETIEVAIALGVDPRHADQMVRGVVSLPNGSGRTVRVATRPMLPRRRVRISSVRKISPRSSSPARSSSIGALPRRT
jgi:hypothetical protein